MPRASRQSVRLRENEQPEPPPLLERLFRQSFGTESAYQAGDGAREPQSLAGSPRAMALRGPVTTETPESAVGTTGSLPGFKSSLD